MEGARAVLGVLDYILFAIMLLVSAGIGVYFRFSGGQQKTTEEYLLAGQDMSILPVAFSLMASFLSAITVIGVPAEMYNYGISFAYANIGYVAGMLISAFVTLPVFFELNSSTAYEYLDRRFGKIARTLTSIAFVSQMILYMSVVLYAPALALSAVTNLSTWVSIISIGAICTFYCTLGGMKAVLWTDVFQALLMFLGIFAVLIKGFIDVGFVDVFKIAYDGGRLDFPGFDVDPTQRYTIWNILINGMVLSMTAFSGNQVQIQRMLTVKNISRARMAMYISIPMGVSFHLLNCLTGIVIYSHYSDCDPLTSPEKPISSADQLLPYFMMSSLGEFPGLPGLCICGVFSASLSTVSSAVNSLTAVTMQDLIKPFLVSRGMSQKKMAFSAKAITLFYGFLCVLLTFVVASFGNLIQASLTVFGMLGGPVLAMFFLGMLSTRTNEKGAVIGLLTGITVAAWISFGASVHAPKPVHLPVSVDGCLNPNSTSESLSLLNSTAASSLISHISHSESAILNTTFASEVETVKDSYIFPLYLLSYMWFAPIGLLTSMVVGYMSSILLDVCTGESKEVPRELLSPLIKYFMKNESTEKEKKEANVTGPLELHNPNEKPTNDGAVKNYTETARL